MKKSFYPGLLFGVTEPKTLLLTRDEAKRLKRILCVSLYLMPVKDGDGVELFVKDKEAVKSIIRKLGGRPMPWHSKWLEHRDSCRPNCHKLFGRKRK